MFTTKLTRVTPKRPVAAVAAFSSQATPSPSPCIVARRARPRRPSTPSATSCPSESSSTSVPAATAVVPHSSVMPATQPATSRRRSTNKKRAHPSMSERLASTPEPVDHFVVGLPMVPDVQHLQQSQFGLSSFFSLHRPLSLTTTIPPPSSEEAFHSIFESGAVPDQWANGNSAERRPEDVIYTLHNTLALLEAGASAGATGAGRWDVMPEPHDGDIFPPLDGVVPQASRLDALVAQFKPFDPPPPPQPFSGEDKAASGEKRHQQRRPRRSARPKSYTVIIDGAESSIADAAEPSSAAPRSIFELPKATRDRVLRAPAPSQMMRQPFLTRMHRRQQLCQQAPAPRQPLTRIREPRGVVGVRRAPVGTRRVRMELISVKRQRKLKMKKHKYKKLMKRTRNLRRRLDRA